MNVAERRRLPDKKEKASAELPFEQTPDCTSEREYNHTADSQLDRRLADATY